jgi:hypothetical protein
MSGLVYWGHVKGPQTRRSRIIWRSYCYLRVVEKIESKQRFGLLGSQQTLNAEETTRLTEDNAPASLTTIAIDPVSLAIFDDLLTPADTAA